MTHTARTFHSDTSPYLNGVLWGWATTELSCASGCRSHAPQGQAPARGFRCSVWRDILLIAATVRPRLRTKS